MRRTLITLIIVAFASTASAATASRHAHSGSCSSRRGMPSHRIRCPIVPMRAVVVGTGIRAGFGPFGNEDRAITISVAATADFPHRIVCSMTCSDGAAGAFTAHYEPGIMAGYLAPQPTELEISGNVFCLNVFGTNAIVGGRIEHSNVPAAIGLMYVVVLADHGYPGVGNDLLGAAIFPTLWGLSSYCASMPRPPETPLGRIDSRWPTLESGNFSVVD